jgi:hypothetical protein
VHATSGNFLWRIGFRHQVVKADHWRLLKFIREQKRNLYAGLRAFDPTQVVVGDQGFSGPNRPEKYLELFSGNHLKDALVFWDSAVPRYPANPYDAMPATLEAITLANVGHTNSPTVINNIIDIDRDAWAAGFRKGMVCSIGAFDVEDPGTELFKIADITNTGGTGRRIIVQTHPIGGGVSTGLSRPTVSGVTYPFGVHVRGFLGLIRGLSFDGLTVNVVEDAGFGSAAAITYNFKTAQDPLYIDLDQAIPPPGDGTIPSGGTDAYLNQQWP